MQSQRTYCFFNGEFKSSDQALILTSDLGLQRGYGVFDFARTYNDKLFHFDDHLDRFRHSADTLHLKLAYSDQEITDMANLVIEKSDLRCPGVRLLLTGGYSDTASAFENPNFLILGENLSQFSKQVYEDGVSVMTYRFQRELPQTKSLNYLNALRLEPVRKQRSVYDILYYWTHGVTEFPRGNFFLFNNDTLVTPKSHILFGITRNIVLKLASEGFNIEEREIPFEELHLADEAFITSTSKRIIPVVQIESENVGTGKVGPRTIELMECFNRYTHSYC